VVPPAVVPAPGDAFVFAPTTAVEVEVGVEDGEVDGWSCVVEPCCAAVSA